MKYELGSRIKEFRERLDISQKELAAKLGVSSARLSNWEQGINRPDVDTLPILCQALEISPNALLNVDQVPVSSEDLSLLRSYHDLDEHGKRVVDAVLQIEYERCVSDNTNKE